MKRPSFQFYPSDWIKDPELMRCSFEAQGAWIRLICLMHECVPYGHLANHGKPMAADEIARGLPGLSVGKVRKILAELEEKGVSSRTPEGVIFCRRLVRDEDLRNRRATGGNSGAKYGSLGASYGGQGGRPRKKDPPLHGYARGVKNPPPSSSSSSSISPPTPSAVENLADLLPGLLVRNSQNGKRLEEAGKAGTGNISPTPLRSV